MKLFKRPRHKVEAKKIIGTGAALIAIPALVAGGLGLSATVGPVDSASAHSVALVGTVSCDISTGVPRWVIDWVYTQTETPSNGETDVKIMNYIASEWGAGQVESWVNAWPEHVNGRAVPTKTGNFSTTVTQYLPGTATGVKTARMQVDYNHNIHNAQYADGSVILTGTCELPPPPNHDVVTPKADWSTYQCNATTNQVEGANLAVLTANPAVVWSFDKGGVITTLAVGEGFNGPPPSGPGTYTATGSDGSASDQSDVTQTSIVMTFVDPSTLECGKTTPPPADEKRTTHIYVVDCSLQLTDTATEYVTPWVWSNSEQKYVKGTEVAGTPVTTTRTVTLAELDILGVDHPVCTAACVNTSSYVVTDTNEQGFNYSPTGSPYADTRSKGHYEYVPGALHLLTEDTSSLSKVQGARTVAIPLTQYGGSFSVNFVFATPTSGTIKPGINVGFDVDNDGDVDFYGVAEPGVAGYKTFWTNTPGYLPLSDPANPGNDNGQGGDYAGDQNDILKNFPHTIVRVEKFSQGSGVKADGNLISWSTPCSEYTYDRSPQPKDESTYSNGDPIFNCTTHIATYVKTTYTVSYTWGGFENKWIASAPVPTTETLTRAMDATEIKEKCPPPPTVPQGGVDAGASGDFGDLFIDPQNGGLNAAGMWIVGGTVGGVALMLALLFGIPAVKRRRASDLVTGVEAP